MRVEGRVQGVGYRAWTARVAAGLGLFGWVRNRSDGAVEAVFHGAPAAVDEMLARCAIGPADARVTRVEVVGSGVGAFDRFEVRATL